MKRVETLAELETLLSPYLLKPHVTNNHYMPDYFGSLIDEGRLYSTVQYDGVLLFVDMQRYYRLYAHLFFTNEPLVVDADKPVTAELPFRIGRPVHTPLRDRLAHAGFNIVSERISLSAGAAEFRTRGEAVTETAAATDFDAVKALLETNFDLVSGFLPHDRELCEDIAAGRVLLVRNTEGHPAAILRYGYDIRRNKLLQLAVTERERGKGCASSLLGAWKQATESNGMLYTIWVAADNGRARRLYEKTGFSPSGIEALTMVRGVV